jgi:DNA-binding transcriptional LysR family regulator
MSSTPVHDKRLAFGPHAELIGIHINRKIETTTRRRSICAPFTRLNLNALLVFAKVAEANSFSEGARRLKIPVSTVSRQVFDLEAQLGVRLLERSTRSLKLTDIGAEILEQARVTLDIRESILGLVSSQLSGVSGRLKISVPPSIASSLIKPLVGAFQASYPDVRAHINISDQVADLLTGDIDLLVKVGPMKDSSRISRRILTFRYRLLVSPAYLKTCKAPEIPEDLLSHRLLAFSSSEPEIEWRFMNDNHNTEITLTIEPYLSVNDPTSLADALMAGMGIGNLPSVAVGDLVEKGQLIELLPQWRFSTLDVSVVHASNRHVRRPVQEFIRFAAELAPALFPACPRLDRAQQKREDAASIEVLPSCSKGLTHQVR